MPGGGGAMIVLAYMVAALAVFGPLVWWASLVGSARWAVRWDRHAKDNPLHADFAQTMAHAHRMDIPSWCSDRLIAQARRRLDRKAART
jgi:hypothetical protein